MAEKRLSEEQLAVFINHTLIVNQAECKLLKAQGLLKAAQGDLEISRAEFGLYRAQLVADLKIKTTDELDEETGIFTSKKAEPTK